MVKIVLQILDFSSLLLITLLLASTPVKAQSMSRERKIGNSSTLATITNVSQLSDIKTTDWAFQALQFLIKKYGLFSGYGDRTFRGTRALTRNEFAVVLDAAINALEDNPSLDLSLEERKTLQRLEKDFASELKTLAKQVKSLEERVRQINTQSFSTTTQLEGEVVFALSLVGAGDKANGEGRIDSNLTFGNRIRLNFDTSFNGKDRLRARLQTTNVAELNDAAGTDMARLSIQGDDENQLELSRVEYFFPVGEQIEVFFEAVGGSLNDYTNTFNSYLSGSSSGSISRFGQRNPIYRQGDGSGIGISYEISEPVRLDVGFIADEVNEPEIGFGNAAYGAIAQLTLEPTDTFGIGLTYIRSYNAIDTGVGSERANDPFNDTSETIGANSWGIQSSWEISSDLTVGSWVGFSQATALDLPDEPTASILNWALTLAFPDVGKEGSLAGIIIGQPPKAIANDFTIANNEYVDEDTSLHLETFYRYQVSDDVEVTLGFLVITNPEHNSNNDSIYLGTIRTTLSF
jgi:hypothetical protein